MGYHEWPEHDPERIRPNQGRNFTYISLGDPRPPMQWCAGRLQCFVFFFRSNVLLDISFLRTNVRTKIPTNHSIYTYWEYACFYGSYFIGYKL